MSKKNIMESLKDAWRKSVENGQQIDQQKQNETQKTNDIVDNTRNEVLNHIKETDKGFYRSENDYYFHLKDGGALKRQRLVELKGATGEQPNTSDQPADDPPEETVEQEVDRLERERNQADRKEADRRAAEEAEEAEKSEEPEAPPPGATGEEEPDVTLCKERPPGPSEGGPGHEMQWPPGSGCFWMWNGNQWIKGKGEGGEQAEPPPGPGEAGPGTEQEWPPGSGVYWCWDGTNWKSGTCGPGEGAPGEPPPGGATGATGAAGGTCGPGQRMGNSGKCVSTKEEQRRQGCWALCKKAAQLAINIKYQKAGGKTTSPGNPRTNTSRWKSRQKEHTANKARRFQMQLENLLLRMRNMGCPECDIELGPGALNIYGQAASVTAAAAGVTAETTEVEQEKPPTAGELIDTPGSGTPRETQDAGITDDAAIKWGTKEVLSNPDVIAAIRDAQTSKDGAASLDKNATVSEVIKALEGLYGAIDWSEENTASVAGHLKKLGIGDEILSQLITDRIPPTGDAERDYAAANEAVQQYLRDKGWDMSRPQHEYAKENPGDKEFEELVQAQLGAGKSADSAQDLSPDDRREGQFLPPVPGKPGDTITHNGRSFQYIDDERGWVPLAEDEIIDPESGRVRKKMPSDVNPRIGQQTFAAPPGGAAPPGPSAPGIQPPAETDPNIEGISNGQFGNEPSMWPVPQDAIGEVTFEGKTYVYNADTGWIETVPLPANENYIPNLINKYGTKPFIAKGPIG